MGKRLNTDGADFAVMLGGLKVPDGNENRRLLVGESPAIIEPATRLVKIMLKEKLLNNSVNPSQLIAPELQGCMQ
jgi:hypothetical protein